MRFAPLLRRYRFELVPLQTARTLFGLEPRDSLVEMKLLLADGKIFGGAEAFLQIVRKIWWAWPLYAISFLPGIRPLLDALYRQIAAGRNCFTGQCNVQTGHKLFITDWIPLVVLPLAAWLLTFRSAPWINCWALVVAIVWGFKRPVWRRAERRFGKGNRMGQLAFFLWPGMDAKFFLHNTSELPDTKSAEWLSAVLKTILGAVLTWFVARNFAGGGPLIAGWIGMIGLVFLLHFGMFHLVALIYRKAGIAVEPIMRAPIRSESLGEFWGCRWNLAFNKLAYDFGFAPLKKRVGIAWATLIVFAASGLIHEIVISVPARGGYGLPTVYFLIQGLGILFERTKLAKAIGLGHGVRGWLFTAICTAAPACWLFHPPFVRNVILPMLHAIGAT